MNSTHRFFTAALVLVAATLCCVATEVARGDSDSVTEQTKRVTGDSFVKALVKPIEKRYRVNCKFPSLEAADQAVKWTCLNNMACTYKFTLRCFDHKQKDKERVELSIYGLDDNNSNEVESLHIKKIDQ